MKKFVINADYGGQMGPCTIYIGQSEDKHHPIHFQSDYLNKQKNVTISSEIMDALTELKEISIKNKVLFEDLCVYAIGPDEDSKKASAKEEPDDEEDEGFGSTDDLSLNEEDEDNLNTIPDENFKEKEEPSLVNDIDAASNEEDSHDFTEDNPDEAAVSDNKNKDEG